jgi:hypothetical protein
MSEQTQKTTVEEKPGEKKTTEETSTPGVPEKKDTKTTVEHPNPSQQ